MTAVSPPALLVCTTLAFVAACIAVDIRERRIPNALSGPAMLVGLVLNGVLFGTNGLLAGLAGFAVAVAVLIVPFALGGIGAGDLKMMAAVGALLGPRLALAGLLAGMILGGVVMGVHLARHSRLGEKLSNLRTMVTNAVLARSVAPLRVSMTANDAVALPYSVPLGLGTAGVIAISFIRG